VSDHAVELSDKECELLRDVIDTQLEGMADAKEQTTVDPSIKSPEELLEYVAGLEDDRELLISIRKKVE
jgi:hypothetical protein